MPFIPETIISSLLVTFISIALGPSWTKSSAADICLFQERPPVTGFACVGLEGVAVQGVCVWSQTTTVVLT